MCRALLTCLNNRNNILAMPLFGLHLIKDQAQEMLTCAKKPPDILDHHRQKVGGDVSMVLETLCPEISVATSLERIRNALKKFFNTSPDIWYRW
mmetsp:Transcript_38144/g.55971  ORF Transcript_38144/g.55971 Transcript_38144/m.55971 type:complete len:94 (-) Transcript_38144:416-697(-)